MPLRDGLFWSHLADDLVTSGRFDEAGRQLIKALASGPDAALMNRLGQVHFLQGSLDEAEHCFRQAAEWGPSAYSPWLELAKLALHRQQREEALRGPETGPNCSRPSNTAFCQSRLGLSAARPHGRRGPDSRDDQAVVARQARFVSSAFEYSVAPLCTLRSEKRAGFQAQVR